MLPEKELQCPYCWETYPIIIDDSEEGEVSFVYDCEVCCRPIDVRVSLDEDGELVLSAQRSA